MLSRRGILAGLFSAAAVVAAAPVAEASSSLERLFGFKAKRKARPGKVAKRAGKKPARLAGKARKTRKPRAPAYAGARVVDYASAEKPGTIIIKTSERALYQILGDGKAKRYLVAVGKEGFSWAGTAKIAMKAENPRWTPPPEMIQRSPRFAKWAKGMPGGIPQNPLGVRALYLYQGKTDTGFRIHGTNAPSSIGTASSSGCIRMLNHEVVELYENTRLGTKVIVI